MMFKRLLGFGGNANRAITESLYGEIVAAARQAEFYSELGVDDTPLGRFEMLALHMVLFLERADGAGEGMREVAQELTDAFFLDIDHSLRELGIGDLGVPKRMKKLARMFYGRASAYAGPMKAGDVPALAAALARNVRPDDAGWADAERLARHALAVHRALARQPDAAILSGRLDFPRIAAAAEAAP